MNVEASIFFDLLLLSLHRNDEKVKILAGELFELFDKNLQFIADSDVKYINLYVSIIKEVIVNRLIIDKSNQAVMGIIRKHFNSKQFDREERFKESLYEGIGEDMALPRLVAISERLNNFILWHKSNGFVKSLYGNLRECSISFDPSEQTVHLNKMQGLLGDFQRTIADLNSSVGDGTSVEKIDFTNLEDIQRAYKTYQERKVTTVLKTGLKGLNKMFGPRGGAALGESVIFFARGHNYKSTMLMSVANWIAKYSVPPKSATNPLILFISLENEAYENMMIMFEMAYVVITGSKPVGISDDDIIAFIHDYFSKCGYVLVVERYLPDRFGQEEFQALVERYEASGYQVVAALIDYMSQMKKSNGVSSSMGNNLLIKTLYNGMCNYMKAKGSTLFSAHQMNRKADELISSGVPNPIRRFGPDHIADSADVYREIDCGIYLNIEKNDSGVSYLTINWGKHRYVNDTPEVDKYCAYPFTEHGIIDDVDADQNGFTRNIYASKNQGDVSSSDMDDLLSL